MEYHPTRKLLTICALVSGIIFLLIAMSDQMGPIEFTTALFVIVGSIYLLATTHGFDTWDSLHWSIKLLGNIIAIAGVAGFVIASTVIAAIKSAFREL
jgi:hypothetical protein